MKKKILSIVLAGAMASSLIATSALSASALEPGGYDSLGPYTPSANVKNTNHLMFAMPGAWLNDTTANEKVNNAAGIYWWNGYDTCPDTAKAKNMHEWPGYMANKVEEEGVENLWAIDVPTYGNGETGDAMTILWNNSLNGGTDTDPATNPFYEAAQQTKNIKAQYYCKSDEHKYYDILFRYVYNKAMVQAGVLAEDELDITSPTFWEDINKKAAVENGADWDKLNALEKTYQTDEIIDEMDVDLSEFGTYASNFFNEDLVGDSIYPAEESNGDCLSFHFDNMVFVVNFDPAEMQISDVSPKVGFGGDWFFYYGKGDYGTWPTKELNDTMAEKLKDNKDFTVVSGNFMSDEYWKSSMENISVPTVPATSAPVPTPAPDATSSSSGSTSGTSANNSNGAIATGQVSFAVIAFVILIAGVGVVYFTRRKRED